MSKDTPGKLLRDIYAGNIFGGVHYALVVYVISSFVTAHSGEAAVSIVYSLIALISLVISLNFSNFISKIGHRKLTTLVIILMFGSLLVLTTAVSPLIANTLVIVYSVSQFLLYISFDIYVKELSKDGATGNIRGVYLTIYNLSFLAGPFLTGVLLGKDSNFTNVFLVSALVLLPLFYFDNLVMRAVKDVRPKDHHVMDAIKIVRKSIDIRKIFISGCFLEFFYTWMTIYTPIYLHINIGFSWPDIGIIFTIMLLPFVLFQIPLGMLADKYYGETEMLTAGFIIAGIATIGLYFITSKSILVWALMLFLTRTGASCIEIMNDTYFFKKVPARDTGVVALFRNARQINYLFAPLVALLILAILPMQALFIVLGAAMFIGAYNASNLHDTL